MIRKDTNLNVRMPSEKLETYKAIAKAQKMTLSYWIEMVLDKAVLTYGRKRAK